MLYFCARKTITTINNDRARTTRNLRTTKEIEALSNDFPLIKDITKGLRKNQYPAAKQRVKRLLKDHLIERVGDSYRAIYRKTGVAMS